MKIVKIEEEIVIEVELFDFLGGYWVNYVIYGDI